MAPGDYCTALRQGVLVAPLQPRGLPASSAIQKFPDPLDKIFSSGLPHFRFFPGLSYFSIESVAAILASKELLIRFLRLKLRISSANFCRSSCDRMIPSARRSFRQVTTTTCASFFIGR
jgi:hypothetical protein